MSYLALYRKFRPQVFDDLIGQETVVRALKNQIRADKIGHAYLFCGARGTGKTTAAKIFARAINCEKRESAPCGKCSVCLKLGDPNTLDIVEMDAASNNRVENVREIREKVQYPPVAGRYKVYIIDEVHMLTTEAFNALLKTLEEPPKHAVFILATTEPHKLPSTILSRCMRFDFKLIPTQKIADLIGVIFDKEGKQYDKEAVVAIAKAGEGSVRDALSIADVCMSYKSEKLTYSDVIEVLGASDRNKTSGLVEAIFDGYAGTALAVVDELSGLGKNVGMLVKDVLSFLRDVMVAKTCKQPSAILSLPQEDVEELNRVARKTDNHGLLRTVEIFSKIENDVKYSTHPRVIFETAVVKATTASADYNIDALISRITKLENALKGVDLKEKNVAVGDDGSVSGKTGSVAVNGLKTNKNETIELKDLAQPTDKRETVKTKTEPTAEYTARVKERNTDAVEVSVPVEIAEKPTDSAVGTLKRRNRLSREERLRNDLSAVISVQEEDVPPENMFEAFEKSADFTKPTEEKRQVNSDKSEMSVPAEQTSIAENNVQNSKKMQNAVADKRIWGTVIRGLRQTGNSTLWVVCQEFDATVADGKILLSTSNEQGYEIINNPKNLTEFKKVVAGICPYTVEIKLISEKEDTFEKDVETVKSVIGNVEVDE